ncbi:MAG: cell division protein SepF [Clostridiales bacterium]|nr:cell division protein SepF [Clostridiales bacterium]
MANEDFFENFLRNSSNYNGGLEYYEDTHDAYGNYIGGARPAAQGGVQYTTPTSQGYNSMPPQQGVPFAQSPAAQRTEQSLSNPTRLYGGVPNNVAAQQQNKAKPLPTTEQGILPQLNRNFVIYRPRTTADVEQLIAYLRRGEPALVDLDPISDSPDAQRLMDFTSGAAYALGDRVITVRRNLFLITPDTMDVLKPESDS